MKVTNLIRARYEIYKSCIQLLAQGERKRVYLIMLLQVLLTGIDVLAVALVSALGALMVTGIQSQAPGERISKLLELLGVNDLSFQNQIAILAIVAAALLIFKTLATMYFFKKQVFFLSNVTARISKETISRMLTAPYLILQNKSVFNYVYATSSGVSSVTNGVISTSISIFADFALLFALVVSLLIVDPVMGLMSISFFGLTSLLIYSFQSQKARTYGHMSNTVSIAGDTALNNVLSTHKEMSVKARLGYFEKLIHENKNRVAELRAYMTFMPALPRYLLDLVLVVGGVLICGVQFLLNDARVAFATLSVFLVASSRMLPALVRIQQGLVIIRSSVATAEPFLALNRELPEANKQKLVITSFSRNMTDFKGNIKLSDVEFRYKSNSFVLEKINLEIEENSFCAFAGPSGSGKTTLMDLMLGVIEPNHGKVNISEVPAGIAISRYPGAIAYLPQDVQIIEGTIRENVQLGFDAGEIQDSYIWEALERAQLSDLVSGLENGIDTKVGPRGVGLSGGQKQRLAIARALVTKPKILFLDEATSALDSETERAVTEAILELKGKVTLVVIAHRLSTIVNADKVIYMRNGKVEKQGTFKEITKEIPQLMQELELLDAKLRMSD
jgi:ABC-type multidrug transport system fused ATPase/permease subunit